MTAPAAPAAQTGAGLLAQAQQAARRGDAAGMIEALLASGFLDGLVRKVAFTYPALDPIDVRDMVATATTAAFEKVRSGKAITRLGGFLSAAVTNMATDKWEEVSRRAPASEIPDRSDEDEIDDELRARTDALSEHRRDEALRLARQLLPQVGQGQVLDVMTMVIDAVAKRDMGFSSETVSDVLGISRASARKLMSRGLDRLRRAAVAAGVELPDEIPSIPDTIDAKDASEETSDE